MFNSLKRLKDLEHNRLVEAAKLRDDDFVLLEVAPTVCSNDDSVDLEALNLICSGVAEGLGDGGCDPVILQTPISHKRGGRPGSRKKNKKNKNKNKNNNKYNLR